MGCNDNDTNCTAMPLRDVTRCQTTARWKQPTHTNLQRCLANDQSINAKESACSCCCTTKMARESVPVPARGREAGVASRRSRTTDAHSSERSESSSGRHMAGRHPRRRVPTGRTVVVAEVSDMDDDDDDGGAIDSAPAVAVATAAASTRDVFRTTTETPRIIANVGVCIAGVGVVDAAAAAIAATTCQTRMLRAQ